MSYLQTNSRRSLAHALMVTQRLIERRTKSIAKERQKSFRALAWIDWMQKELRGANYE